MAPATRAHIGRLLLVWLNVPKFLLSVVVVTSIATGFAADYYYRVLHVPISAVVEDYALVNVLEDVGNAHYLAKGEFESMRSMLDVSLNTHLSRVRINGGAISGQEAEAARTRILNAAAVPLGALSAVSVNRVARR
jgi:hypothetical protein